MRAGNSVISEADIRSACPLHEYEISDNAHIRPTIPISVGRILRRVAPKLVIVGRGIRLLISLQNQKVTANR